MTPEVFFFKIVIMSYQVLETTADFGVIAQGKTLAEAFEWAAYGMFDQMAELERVEVKESLALQVEGNDQPSLLVAWLNELLYTYEVKEFLPKVFKVEEITANFLKAQIKGESLDLEKHRILTHIKAVTYHNLAVEPTDKGFRVQVLFDV